MICVETISKIHNTSEYLILALNVYSRKRTLGNTQPWICFKDFRVKYIGYFPWIINLNIFTMEDFTVYAREKIRKLLTYNSFNMWQNHYFTLIRSKNKYSTDKFMLVVLLSIVIRKIITNISEIYMRLKLISQTVISTNVELLPNFVLISELYCTITWLKRLTRREKSCSHSSYFLN